MRVGIAVNPEEKPSDWTSWMLGQVTGTCSRVLPTRCVKPNKNYAVQSEANQMLIHAEVLDQTCRNMMTWQQQS